jgi:hypothetical protein
MDHEEHRHRCEVRQVLAWRVEHGLRYALDYVAAVGKARGESAAQQLRDACREQWAAGNRGASGDWR